MTFQVLPVEKDDWPGLIDISHRAWVHDAVWSCLYPDLDTPAGRSQAIARISDKFDQDPAKQWIKIVEDGSGTIAGAACWLFLPEDPYSPDKAGKGMNAFRTGDWLGDKDDPTRQFFEFFYNEKRFRRRDFHELRRAHDCRSKLKVSQTWSRH